jgi:hypothetical protein
MRDRLPANLRLVSAAALTMALLGTGCTPTLVPLDRSELLRLRDERVIRVVQYSPASLSVMTPGKAAVAGAFGLIGGLIAAGLAKAQAETLQKEYSLEDPAAKVGERLLAGLSAELGPKGFQPVEERLESDDLEDLRTRFGGDLVLDVKTDRWAIGYFPADWSRYRITYAVRARLLRPQDAQTLWLGYCKFEEETGSTWDELTANAGAALRLRFDHAADKCAQDLLAQFGVHAAAGR